MARKPKPALAVWLINQRKAHGETVADVARITDRTEATVRGWEAGRPPSSEDPVIAHLERHWGAIAPKDAGLDQSDLAGAIRALVEEMRLDRQEQVRWREAVQEALVAALNGRVDGAPTNGPASQPHEGAPR